MTKPNANKLRLLKKHFPLLKHLAKCTAGECEHIIAGMSDDVIKLMSQICVNVMNKSLIRDPKDAVKRLAPYKKQLRGLTKGKSTIKQKRKHLEQKGGFLGALLGIALPLITSLISSFTGRK